MKRKIYIAERIRIGTPTVPVHPLMSVDEVREGYKTLCLDMGTFIHNGHWMLRGPQVEGVFPKKQIPDAVSPTDIWEMCKQKIDDSDAFVGIIQMDAYGAVAEAGYAIGKGKAVYVLPESESDEIFKEMWFIFHMSLSTMSTSHPDDFSVPIFAKYGISDVVGYTAFIESIIPPFLKDI